MKYYKHRKLFLRLRGGKEQNRTGLNPPEPLWPAVSSQSQDWNWIHKTEPDTISPRPASLPPEVWHEGQEEGKKEGGGGQKEEAKEAEGKEQWEVIFSKLSLSQSSRSRGMRCRDGLKGKGGMWRRAWTNVGSVRLPLRNASLNHKSVHSH